MTNVVLPYNPAGSDTKSIEGVMSNFTEITGYLNAGIPAAELDLSLQGSGTIGHYTALATARQPSVTRPTIVIGTVAVFQGNANLYWSPNNPPTTGSMFIVAQTDSNSLQGQFPFCLFVPAGWWWQVNLGTAAGGALSAFEHIL